MTAGILAGVLVVSAAVGTLLFLAISRALTKRFDEALIEKARLFVALSSQEREYDGTIVSVGDLPAIARSTVQQHAGTNPIVEIEQIDDAGRLLYKVECVRDGIESEFLVSGTGQYLGEVGELSFAFRNAALPEFEVSDAPEYYQVWDEEDEPIAKSPSLGGKSLLLLKSGADHPVVVDGLLPDGRYGRIVALTFVPRSSKQPGDEASEEFTLVMARSSEPLNQTLRVVGSAIALAVLLLAIGSAAIVAYTVRRGLRPLNALASQTERIDANHLDFRFRTETLPEELAPIAARLNDLLGRLGAAFERERRFTSDVAHELRTPIAELRSLADVGLRTPSIESDTRQFLTDTRAASIQMERLVTSLLTLARSESEQVESVLLDLVALIHDSWRAFAQDAETRRLSVHWETPESCEIKSDKALLGAVLTNLFSNTVAHTPQGGQIRIRVAADEEGSQLSVSNTNPGLTRANIDHLCEPFWKKDPARSDAMHSGLGLALVAQWCRLLNIELRLSLPDPNSFELSIRFPR